MTVWVSLWSTVLTLTVLWLSVNYWLKSWNLVLPWQAITETLLPKTVTPRPTVTPTKQKDRPAAAKLNDDLVVLQEEDLQRMKTKLTAAERTELFTIIMKKLPPEKIQEVSKWLENGLTTAEIMNLEQVIKQYFSENERNIFITKLK